LCGARINNFLRRSPEHRASEFLLRCAGEDLLVQLVDHGRISRVADSIEPLSGMWSVDAYSRDGDPRPALFTDKTRWRNVLFEPFSGAIRMTAIGPGGQWLGGWMIGPDSSYEKLIVRPRGDPNVAFPLELKHPTPDILVMTGNVNGHAPVVTMSRADPRETLLLTRGFHWISEKPFNR
jgi:hypothetical protein